MAQHVLLFHMSLYKTNIKSGQCDRAQTNEAALMDLVRKKERPDKIVALCSDSVRNVPTVSVDGRPSLTTLAYFRQMVLTRVDIPPESLISVPVPDSMDSDAQSAAIAKLLEVIHPGDTLSIDLSGGPRDTAMLLVTAARCLRDLRRVETTRVIYSELLPSGSPKIHDSTQLYDLFDFVTAMDEFFSTGTARKLKTYLYSETLSSPLHGLLAAINQFSDDLSLCRSQAFASDLAAISSALKNVSPTTHTLNDLFFALLTERFNTEFRTLLSDSKNNLPSLVHWCTDHGMYQQALTLLCEQMPAYVCRHLFLQPTQSGLNYLESQIDKNKGKPWVYPLFHFHFCRFYTMSSGRKGGVASLQCGKNADGSLIYRVATESEVAIYLQFMQETGQLIFDAEHQHILERLICSYQGVILYRNQINHASEQDPYASQGSEAAPLNVDAIKNFLSDTSALLDSIRPLKPSVPVGVKRLPVTQKILPR